MGEKQSKWCSECVPPRSAALARQIHHPDTQRVISWGLGNTAATRGIPRWKRGNCTQRHDPLHARSTNYTLDWSKTHEPAMYTSLPCKLNPPQPEKCWQPGSQLASIYKHVRFCFFLHHKRVALPKPNDTLGTGRKIPGVPPYGKKHSPRSSFFNAAPRAATSDLQHNYSKFKARSG